MCDYSYSDKTNSREPIMCKLTSKSCIYSKYCTKVGRFILNDNAESCFMAIEEKTKNIPDGAYRVSFAHHGFLYVELENGQLTQIKDTIGTPTNYVYVKRVNGDYKISLTPFEKTTTKRNTKTKKDA